MFWAFELVSISFCLALAGVMYIGDASTLFSGSVLNSDIGINVWGSWFFFWVNPAATTLLACVLQRCLLTFRRTETDSVHEPVRTRGAGFYVLWFAWFFLGGPVWAFDGSIFDSSLCSPRLFLPSAATVSIQESFSGLALSCNFIAPVVSHTALFVGLAMRFMARRNGNSVNNVLGVSPTSSLRNGSGNVLAVINPIAGDDCECVFCATIVRCGSVHDCRRGLSWGWLDTLHRACCRRLKKNGWSALLDGDDCPTRRPVDMGTSDGDLSYFRGYVVLR